MILTSIPTNQPAANCMQHNPHAKNPQQASEHNETKLCKSLRVCLMGHRGCIQISIQRSVPNRSEKHDFWPKWISDFRVVEGQ
jgi:hypothetical protein